MDGPPGRLERWRAAFLRFWRTENARLALLRDVLVVVLGLGLLLTVVWVASGQPVGRSPIVSVESGSMMHGPRRGASTMETPWGDPPFGRLGSIDPGDIVLVVDVDDVSDIEVAFGKGGRDGYGGHGDVIVFAPSGRTGDTEIIHRAMLYVEANVEGCAPNADCVYRIPAFCDNRSLDEWAGGAGHGLEKYCDGSSDALDFRLERDGLELDFALDPFPCAANTTGCTPFHSGFITRGDNNPWHDQAQGESVSQTVRLEWVHGKARGEIPWLGMVKLALYGNQDTYQGHQDSSGAPQWTILRGRAPYDIWVCAFLAGGLLVGLPMLAERGVALWHRWRRRAPPPP